MLKKQSEVVDDRRGDTAGHEMPVYVLLRTSVWKLYESRKSVLRLINDKLKAVLF